MQVALRRWEQTDAAALCRLADDEKVAANLRDIFPHPYTAQDGQDFIAFCTETDEMEAMQRAVEVDGVLAGSISLVRGTDVAHRSAELGYWLGRSFWGKGIAAEAVRQICALGFAQWDIVRIFAEVFANNRASCRVLEKNEFVCEGTLRSSVVKYGNILDSEIYALIK